MSNGNERKFFNKLRNWRYQKSEFPEELIIDEKTYTGAEEVLNGFAESAYKQSRNSREEKWKPSDQFFNKKLVVRIEEILAKKNKTLVENIILFRSENDALKKIYELFYFHHFF